MIDRIIDRMIRNEVPIKIGGVILWLLFIVSLAASCAWVAVHFIQKYW